MGETSAKRMRGSEMDDVIFAGTANRPSRNVADVTIVLDNSQRKAPALFNEFDEIEVVRRIERGAGSVYRVNGKDVRARDVQLLFADAATGAHSTALVSRSEEHTSELQSLMRISYAVFCLNKKNNNPHIIKKSLTTFHN